MDLERLLQVAASSQNIFKERLKHILYHGDSLAEAGDRGSDQLKLPVHIADDPRQSVLERLSHWIVDTAGPLTHLVKDSSFIAALNVDRGYPDIIRLLFNHGADLGIKISEGETISHLAVVSAPRIKVLLEMGVHMLDMMQEINMCWGRRLPNSGKLAWEARDMEFLRRI